MPIDVGKKRYRSFSDLVRSIEQRKGSSSIKNPEAYAASIARKVEPDFGRSSAKSSERKSGGRD